MVQFNKGIEKEEKWVVLLKEDLRDDYCSVKRLVLVFVKGGEIPSLLAWLNHADSFLCGV